MTNIFNKALPKVLSVVIASCIFVQLLPAVAFCEEASISEDVIKSHLDSTKDERVSFEEEMVDADGTAWTLKYKSEPTWSLVSDVPYRTVEIKEIRPVPTDSPEAASSYFDEEKAYDINGWSGTLRRISMQIRPNYDSQAQQVDFTVTYEGLPNNDVTQIPESHTFDVRSNSAPGAMVSKELELSDIEWVVDSFDSHGVASTYTAYCNYRGTEEFLVNAGYIAECTYRGEVVQATPALDGSDVPASDDADFPWEVLSAIIAAAITAGLVAIIIIWKRRHRAHVIEVNGATETIIAKCKIVTSNGDLSVAIPEDVDISFAEDDDYNELELPKRFCDSDRNLRITQGDVEVFTGLASRRTRVWNPYTR